MFGQNWKTQAKRDQGFTLIELLVVIIILGLLAAIAIPVYLNQRQKAVDAELKTELHSMAKAAEGFSVDNPTAPNFGVGATNLINNLKANGWTMKFHGTTHGVVGSPATGYCIIVWNPRSSNAHSAATAMRYDSRDGGIGGSNGACNSATFPFYFK